MMVALDILRYLYWKDFNTIILDELLPNRRGSFTLVENQ